MPWPIDRVDSPTTQSTESAARLTANVSTAIERLNDVLANFNDMIGDPTVKRDFREVVSNLADGSRDLKQIIADLKPFPAEARKLAETGNRVLENLDRTVDNANNQVTELGKTLKGSLGQLEGVLKNFDRITRSIADGEGTAGKFVRDERLYESLLLTECSLNDSVSANCLAVTCKLISRAVKSPSANCRCESSIVAPCKKSRGRPCSAIS